MQGDTDVISFGRGTFGSRSLSVGGSAIAKATDKIVDKGKKIAAHIMEVSAEDVDFAAGTFTVAGTDKSITIGEVAFAAYVPHNYPLDELEPGLDETAFYDPANFTFPSGTQICEVEIDPETGRHRSLCATAATNQGFQWHQPTPLVADGAAPGWATMVEEESTETAYGPQWSHPHPSFSPDGRRVAFTSDMTGRPQVYVVDVPGE